MSSWDDVAAPLSEAESEASHGAEEQALAHESWAEVQAVVDNDAESTDEGLVIQE